jgi:hypothetical protein
MTHSTDATKHIYLGYANTGREEAILKMKTVQVITDEKHKEE